MALQRLGCTSKKLLSPASDIINICLFIKCLKEGADRFAGFETENKSLLFSETSCKRDQQCKQLLKVVFDENPCDGCCSYVHGRCL